MSKTRLESIVSVEYNAFMDRLGLLLQGLIPFVILVVTSLIVLHSIAPQVATTQFLFVSLGCIVMIIVSRLPYPVLLLPPALYYVTAVVPLIITLFIGSEAKGSLRWLTFGDITFQPSEFTKPLLILFTANFLTRLPTKPTTTLLYSLCMSLAAALVYVQPDLGSAITIMAIAASGLIAAGTPLKHFIYVFLAILLITPIGVLTLKPYQRNRLKTFINPQADPLGSGYNVLQATIAVGSGKLFGRGLGQGTQSHLQFLPERQTDFIFSSIVEELGFLGGALILIAYTWLIVQGMYIAKMSSDDTSSILVLTSIGLTLSQIGINAGMNMGLLPVAGITLPLVSAGGSSFVSFSIILGMVILVAKHMKATISSIEIH